MTNYKDKDTVEITVRVPTRSGGDAQSALYHEIDYAIRQSTVGRIVGDTARRNLVDTVMSTLGFDIWDRTDTDNPLIGSDAELIAAARALLNFIPEGGYSSDFGEFAMKDGDSTFYFGADDAEDYQDMVDVPAIRRAQKNGEPLTEKIPSRDGKHVYSRAIVSSDALPFFSQAIYYPVLGGKHNGRTMNALISNLREAAGMDDNG